MVTDGRAALDAFHEELFNDVQITAQANGWYVEDTFFELICGRIIDAGDLVTADRADYASRGVRIDGYGGNPLEEDGMLSLIVQDFAQSSEVSTLTRTDMEAVFRRAGTFVERALREDFRDSLEETTPAFGLADMIASYFDRLSKIRFVLITNKVLSTRVDGIPADELRSVPVTYSVWDISRLKRLADSATGREEILVDLENDFGGSVSVLPAHLKEADYRAFIAIVPGDQLAAIYDRWGARLLEQNVRVFLQARGNVNRGIRNTLDNDPEMFFAYNNGIAATALDVETEQCPDGLKITRIRDLQIVNGGQTTASIHVAGKRRGVDLSHVFVQMKLAIVDPGRSDEVIPKISEFANTQNRVNAADFFSNHPYHIRMEGFSRRVLAPSPDGTFRESKWFYERARGQYRDARGGLSTAERRRFDLEYPKRQSFTKTDLAKFVSVWDDKPHIVSRGAQKNFADFAATIGKAWERNSEDFNELYYRRGIAKAIVFREMERLVSAADWYEGGYRANIVAYAIAKLSFDLKMDGKELDFERIWRSQSLSPALREALSISSKAVHDIIVDTPTGVRNVTEWAKQQACWNRVLNLDIGWPGSLDDGLLGKQESADLRRGARKDQRILSGIEIQTAVVDAGPQFWTAVKKWAQEAGWLSPREVGVLDVAISLPTRVPSEAQAKVLMDALERYQEEGCPLRIDGDGN